MPTPLRILILEDQLADAELMLHELRQAGFDPEWQRVETEEEYLAALHPTLDIILSDYSLPQFDGLSAVRLLRARGLDLPFILISGTVGEDVAVSAMKEGADDYLLKDRLTRLGPAVKSALEQKRLRDERKQAEAAIQEQAERFRTMMSTISEGFWLVDDKGRLLDVNEAYCRMSAYSKEELLTLSIPDLEAAETQAETAGHIQTIIESGSDLFESRHKAKDGRIFDVEISVAFWPAKRQFFVFIQDISERVQAEAAIQRRDRILESLAYAGEQLLISAALEEGLPDILGHLGKAVEVARVYIFENHSDADGELLTSQRYEWVNAGFTPQIDNPDLQDFHLASNGFSRWIEIMEQGGTIHGNIREFPESERDVLRAQEIQSILVVPIFVGGKWWGFIGFDDCLSEREWFAIEIEALKTAASTLGAAIQRRQAEEALRRNEALLLQTGKMAKVGGWELDLPTMRLLWSLETYRIHEADPSFQPDLENAINFYAPEARPIINEAVRRASEEGRPYDLELPFITAKGRHIWVRAIGQPEFRDGKCVRLFGAFQDITERKQAEKQTQLQLQRLAALRTIDQAIAYSMDVNFVFKVILDHVISQLAVDAAVILLYNPATQALEYATGRGFRTEALQHTRLPLGEGYAGRAALARQMVHIPDLQGRRTDFLRSPTFSQEGFVSYFGVPLIAKGEIKGVLEVFHRSAFEAENEWLNFLETLTGQTAIAIDNANLFKSLQLSNIELSMAYDATIEGWSRAMDLRDKETEGHTQRVTEMSQRLARAMRINEAELVNMRWGALLHDIGKMGVPDSILHKPDKLTDEEWVIMRQHPQFAYDMLSPIEYLHSALDIPFCHHEKWDGSGYPRGLKGEGIPLAARIFAVVDVWDALTSDRPYRAAWPEEKVREYIHEQAGRHFDPQAVKAFMEMLRTE